MIMATQYVPTKIEATRLPPLIHTLLTNPACYDHEVGQMQLVETHISWVLLTGKIAYKIKKPVDLGFLDFSTLTRRKQACADEVRLNRRLAAEMYLGVVVITGNPCAPHINGPDMNDRDIKLRGTPIEYAVEMRQFPVDATLDSLDERGELGTVQIDMLAKRLARFHLNECPSAPANSAWGEPEAIAKPAAENFQLLLERCSDPAEGRCLSDLQIWCEAEHFRLTPLMRERKRQGMVRECHGDLHLGNLAWVDGILVIFDCIEFSPELRWIDIISEVAFCFMDLLHRQHPGLAMRFLNAWLEITGDYEGVALLRYYVVYRALVRAKVAALRAEQSSDSDVHKTEVSSCLVLAECLMQNMPTQLWITHGLSGSGKTTLSQTLLQDYGMVRLRSDIERKRLAGLDALAHSGAGVGQGLYTQETGRRTYRHLSRLAERLLATGWPVIVDAAFLERWQRDLFREVAKRRGLRLNILDITADHATLRERIMQRATQGRDASEADLRVLEHQIETGEPLGRDELEEVARIDGTTVTNE
jgi:aminoglycoside phosphotransferase family enzyme/predicted kinase